jgi:hypothetical protein
MKIFSRNRSKTSVFGAVPLNFRVLILLLIPVFSGCLLRPGREPPLPGFPEELAIEGEALVPRAAPRIQDYQGKAAGGGIPEWVSRYFAGGGKEAEEMAEYQGKYLFVGENRGVSPGALGQWQEAFSPSQDFAQLAAARIEARLVGGAAGNYPDNVYGPFFETMVKSAYDAKFRGGRKEKGFWVHLVPPPLPPAGPEGEDAEEREERPLYVFLVLLSIDRADFEAQVNEIFGAVKARLRLTRNETAAVNRVYENFFDGSF